MDSRIAQLLHRFCISFCEIAKGEWGRNSPHHIEKKCGGFSTEFGGGGKVGWGNVVIKKVQRNKTGKEQNFLKSNHRAVQMENFTNTERDKSLIKTN